MQYRVSVLIWQQRARLPAHFISLTQKPTTCMYTSTCDGHNFVLRYTYTRELYTVVRLRVFKHFSIPEIYKIFITL